MINLDLVRRVSSGGQSKVFIISETELVLWYLFETNLAARLWVFSIWFIWFLLCGSQTVLAYSSFGLTIALYAWSFAFVDDIFRLRLRNPSDWFALFVIEFICMSHFKLLCSVRPKYFASVTFSKEWLWSL